MYETHDLGENAYLRLMGVLPVRTTHEGSNRVVFHYDETDAVAALVRKYWEYKATVEPRMFHASIRAVRQETVGPKAHYAQGIAELNGPRLKGGL